MRILLLLLLLLSCTTPKQSPIKEYRNEPAFCRNTLQHDIHRNECR